VEASLIDLVEEISSQSSIQAVAWVLLAAQPGLQRKFE
jgi:hypothetical protein